MRIYKVLLAFLIPIFCWTAEIITQPLLDLLKQMDVSHDGTLPSIVQATQKQWLRPSNKERWQVIDLYSEKRKQILAAAEKLGFIHEIFPSKVHYDYALVLGGITQRMEERIAHLTELYQKGVRFDKIILLSGARPLDPEVDTLLEGCATESDAIHVQWKDANLPEGMRKVPVVFVDTPIIKTAKGERRPNTIDTIVDWISRGPKPGSCLVISTQPYVHYQGVVVRGVCPQFQVETVGKGARIEKLKNFDVLDSIAKWLYGENFIIGNK